MTQEAFAQEIVSKINSAFGTTLTLEFKNENCMLFTGSHNGIGICAPDLLKFDIQDSAIERDALVFGILHEASHTLVGDIGNPHVEQILGWAPSQLGVSEEQVYEDIGLKTHINVDGFAAKLHRMLGYHITGINYLFVKICDLYPKLCDKKITEEFAIRSKYASDAYLEGWTDWRKYFKIIPVCDHQHIFNFLSNQGFNKIENMLGPSCVEYNQNEILSALKASLILD